MNKLFIITKAEYYQEVKSKSFWFTTILMPLLIVGLGAFIGYLASESDAMSEIQKSTAPDKDMTAAEAMGMCVGVFLTMFVIMYGSMIFNKVKSEKTNRIVEVLVSCVSGRTIMFGKVLSVGLIGLTQMALWGAFIGIFVALALLIFPIGLSMSQLINVTMAKMIIYGLLYFIGGFTFYGGLFACCGALTDRNNENQGYLSMLMMLLMISFYIGVFSVDTTGPLSYICLYIPFTSATVGAAQSIAGIVPWYSSLLSLLVLYASAAVTLIFAGKIYTSAILLKGKSFSPKDILVFLKAK